MDGNQSCEDLYVYHTYACGHGDTNEEFSVELYDFSTNLDHTGNPIKKITCFDELLDFLDETN